MKTKRNILIAFLLNLLFAVVEFVGGALTGSVAILSDAYTTWAIPQVSAFPFSWNAKVIVTW